MRKFLPSLLLLFFTITTSFSQHMPIKEVRNEYFHSSFGSELIVGFNEKLIKISKRTPLIIAYDAATKAVMTRTTWNWFRKLDYLKESRKLFMEAVEKDPGNVEIRILRITVEDRIPFYLGYSDHMEDDKEVIIKNLHTYDTYNVDPKILKYLHERLSENDVFSEHELKLIERKLSNL